jgi:hypothetical protein
MGKDSIDQTKELIEDMMKAFSNTAPAVVEQDGHTYVSAELVHIIASQFIMAGAMQEVMGDSGMAEGLGRGGTTFSILALLAKGEEIPA